MTQEIVRKLVNGVWETVVADQGGGPGGGITEITSTDMSVTITDPTGPTADLSVSGGAQPDLIRVPFAFDTASINVGVDVHTFAAGDYLLAAWIEVLTAWDGTTPKGDFGFVAHSNFGLLAAQGSVADLSLAWGEAIAGSGALQSGDPNALFVPPYAAIGSNAAPIRFTAPNTLQVWASRDGISGGTATGGAAGSGAIVLRVGTTT